MITHQQVSHADLSADGSLAWSYTEGTGKTWNITKGGLVALHCSDWRRDIHNCKAILCHTSFCGSKAMDFFRKPASHYAADGGLADACQFLCDNMDIVGVRLGDRKLSNLIIAQHAWDAIPIFCTSCCNLVAERRAHASGFQYARCVSEIRSSGGAEKLEQKKEQKTTSTILTMRKTLRP